MRGLITHEESQAVTMAFRKKGHEFFSNDLQDCSGGHPEWHRKGDCFSVYHQFQASQFSWLNFYGAHPDCTFLTNAGVRWIASKKPLPGYEWSVIYDRFINWERYREMQKAAHHFLVCYKHLKHVGRGYLENPIMHRYAMEIIKIQPTQIVHPYYFGTPQMKATGLWIVGLPDLVPDNMLTPPKDKKERLKWQDVWMASPGPNRKKIRSKTDPNVARAKAEQWG